MKMSTKGRYAVMAMIDIAGDSAGAPVSLGEIAARQDISQEYRQLFGKLRKAGLVESARGPGGGYKLSLPTWRILPWRRLSRRSMSPCA